jgi:Leucine-rich repeat (LRR) protein
MHSLVFLQNVSRYISNKTNKVKSNVNKPHSFTTINIWKPLKLNKEKKIIEHDKNTLVMLNNIVYRNNKNVYRKILAKYIENDLLCINDENLMRISNMIKYINNDVKRLIVCSNKLTSLSIGKLTNLTYLICSKNNFTKFPKHIIKLSKLRYLDISGNELTKLPQSIIKLTQLKSLDISENKMTKLPTNIYKLTKLEQFSCKCIKIHSITIHYKLNKYRSTHKNIWILKNPHCYQLFDHLSFCKI